MNYKNYVFKIIIAFNLTKIFSNNRAKLRQNNIFPNISRTINEKLNMSVENVPSVESIHEEVEKMVISLIRTLEECLWLRERRSSQGKSWMTSQIRYLARKRRLHWDECQVKLWEYRKVLRKARRSSWEGFSEQVNIGNDTSKINKFLTKSPIQAEFLMGE